MQTKTIICLILFLGFQFHKGICQQTEGQQLPNVSEKKKINFFVVSKRKKGKLDMATRYNVFRSKVRGFFCKRQFVSIVARDAKHASLKITKRLQANDARLGTIWFDSHGMYKKGYSLFYIGSDEISYKTLKDQTWSIPSQTIRWRISRTQIVQGFMLRTGLEKYGNLE